MPFAKNLKKIRHERGLSQNQLAKICKVHYSTIFYWESGKRTPKLDEIKRIAKALKVTISQLFINYDNQEIETTEDTIIIKGQKIDISGLDATDMNNIIKYISQIKSKREIVRNSPQRK
jgi:transcriptional regulator with XRE-family HTH domain